MELTTAVSNDKKKLYQVVMARNINEEEKEIITIVCHKVRTYHFKGKHYIEMKYDNGKIHSFQMSMFDTVKTTIIKEGV